MSVNAQEERVESALWALLTRQGGCDDYIGEPPTNCLPDDPCPFCMGFPLLSDSTLARLLPLLNDGPGRDKVEACLKERAALPGTCPECGAYDSELAMCQHAYERSLAAAALADQGQPGDGQEE